MNPWLKYSLIGVGVLLVFLAILFYGGVVFPLWGIPFNGQRHGQVPLTPAWALECWLWDGDVLTEAYSRELLDGYLQRDFPVRTLLIDFPWATRLNDFHFDPARYPHPEQLIEDLHDRGIRAVLWMTTMVNSKSSDVAVVNCRDWYEEAVRKGYLCGGGHQVSWWLGEGGFIDYTNPEAMKWWRGLQENVFAMGIDGWKLDDTATFFSSRLGKIPIPYQKTYGGWMTTRGYMDHYYRDEYQYGLTKKKDFVTLSRPIDSPTPWGHPEGFCPLDAAAVNWVGDNQHVWEDRRRGLERAIKCILESARLGYNIVGSDVGGYHGSMSIPSRLYIRWAQFSTFCGLFLNGGHEERRLWLRSQDELEIIRTYSWLHTELVPYMYNSVVEAHNGGKVLMRPMREGRYQYGFGDWLLVAPLYQDTFSREVVLPKGRWRYWFDDTNVIEGGKTIIRDYALDQYPVFIRDGAIIPMHISRPYTGIGTEDWDSFLTLNIYPYHESRYMVHHADGSGVLAVTVSTDTMITVKVEGVMKPLILRVLSELKPSMVRRNGVALVERSDWTYDAIKQRLVVTSRVAEPATFEVAFAGQ